ncbi:hypothetical protein DIPPA_04759 [Diplonema papillatum]|nr:hypothetical protein DIPPA_04759 [Diplonema papillatum]
MDLATELWGRFVLAQRCTGLTERDLVDVSDNTRQALAQSAGFTTAVELELIEQQAAMLRDSIDAQLTSQVQACVQLSPWRSRSVSPSCTVSPVAVGYVSVTAAARDAYCDQRLESKKAGFSLRKPLGDRCRQARGISPEPGPAVGKRELRCCYNDASRRQYGSLPPAYDHEPKATPERRVAATAAVQACVQSSPWRSRSVSPSCTVSPVAVGYVSVSSSPSLMNRSCSGAASAGDAYCDRRLESKKAGFSLRKPLGDRCRQARGISPEPGPAVGKRELRCCYNDASRRQYGSLPPAYDHEPKATPERRVAATAAVLRKDTFERVAGNGDDPVAVTRRRPMSPQHAVGGGGGGGGGQQPPHATGRARSPMRQSSIFGGTGPPVVGNALRIAPDARPLVPLRYARTPAPSVPTGKRMSYTHRAKSASRQLF